MHENGLIRRIHALDTNGDSQMIAISLKSLIMISNKTLFDFSFILDQKGHCCFIGLLLISLFTIYYTRTRL